MLCMSILLVLIIGPLLPAYEALRDLPLATLRWRPFIDEPPLAESSCMAEALAIAGSFETDEITFLRFIEDSRDRWRALIPEGP